MKALSGLYFFISIVCLIHSVSSQSSGAQGSSNAPAPSPSPSGSQNVITSTSVSTFVTLGPDRQVSTGTRTFLITTTLQNTPAPTGNQTAGNSTASGNATSSASSTSTHPLPTAPTNVDGGGDGGAPFPGQSSAGGIYGPDDGYIAAATSLQINSILVGVLGMFIGGAITLL